MVEAAAVARAGQPVEIVLQQQRHQGSGDLAGVWVFAHRRARGGGHLQVEADHPAAEGLERLHAAGLEGPAGPGGDGQQAALQHRLGLLPAGDLGSQIAAHHKHQLAAGPARRRPLQGGDRPSAAQLLPVAEPRVVDGGYQLAEQGRPLLQGRAVLLEGVVAGPGGHRGIELQQALQQGLVAESGGIGAGAE